MQHSLPSYCIDCMQSAGTYHFNSFDITIVMQFATPFYPHIFVANSWRDAGNDDIQYVADVWWQSEKNVLAAYLDFKML